MKDLKKNNSVVKKLKVIAGKKYVLTTESSKEHYCKGWRYGGGSAIAVVKPGTLLEIWEIIQVCVDFNIINWAILWL